jgi:hypothetical protein
LGVKRVPVQRVVAALLMWTWKLRLILVDSVAQAPEPIAIDIVEQA